MLARLSTSISIQPATQFQSTSSSVHLLVELLRCSCHCCWTACGVCSILQTARVATTYVEGCFGSAGLAPCRSDVHCFALANVLRRPLILYGDEHAALAGRWCCSLPTYSLQVETRVSSPVQNMCEVVSVHKQELGPYPHWFGA